jgi:hypothetical protein
MAVGVSVVEKLVTNSTIGMVASVLIAENPATNSTIGIYAKASVRFAVKYKPNSTMCTFVNVFVAEKNYILMLQKLKAILTVTGSSLMSVPYAGKNYLRIKAMLQDTQVFEYFALNKEASGNKTYIYRPVFRHPSA